MRLEVRTRPILLAAALGLAGGCGHAPFPGRWLPGSLSGISIAGAGAASQALVSQRVWSPAPPLPLDPDAPTAASPSPLELSAPRPGETRIGGNVNALDATDTIAIVMQLLEASLRTRPADDALCEDTIGECIPDPPRLLPARAGPWPARPPGPPAAPKKSPTD
jgi:hypothetical protein